MEISNCVFFCQRFDSTLVQVFSIEKQDSNKIVKFLSGLQYVGLNLVLSPYFLYFSKY